MKFWQFSALVGAVLLSGQAAFAQSASSLDSDLQCVAWSAATGDRAKTEQEKNMSMMLLFYYIGRWEGATGRTIDTALTADYINRNMNKIESAGPGCLQRGGELAKRMIATGESLKGGEGK